MKMKIDLKVGCEHDLCNCIAEAIEEQVLPAAYEAGYEDGYSDIVLALPTIMRSAGEAASNGISAEKWLSTMQKTLLDAVESGVKKGGSKFVVQELPN